VISAVLIFLLFFWIRKTGKLTWGEGVFFAVLTLILVTLVWLKLEGKDFKMENDLKGLKSKGG